MVAQDKTESPFKEWYADTRGPTAAPLVDYGDWFDQPAYQDVECQDTEFHVMKPTEGKAFLPKRRDSVTIIAGIQKPTEVKLQPQHSVALCPKYLKYHKSFVLNTGGSIWGLDFAPKPPSASDPHIQYLAVAGYPGTTEEHHNVGEIQEAGSVENCIQIWRMDLRLVESQENPVAAPTLDLCIAHDLGIIRALQWCPLGTYQEPLEGQTFTPRLGIMAVAFGDGSIRLISVPHPDGLRMKDKGKGKSAHSDERKRPTVYIKLQESLAILSIPDTCLTTISWGGPYKLIAGCSKGKSIGAAIGIHCALTLYCTGNISLWNVELAIKNRAGANKDTATEDIAHTLVYNVKAHTSAIRDVAYHSRHDSNEHDFVSCGQDGRVRCFDDRDPWTGATYWKNRGFMNTVAWPPYTESFFFSDVERNLRSARTGVSTEHGGTRKEADNRGEIWQFDGSYYHPFILFSSSDGWLKMKNHYHGKLRGQKTIVTTIYRMKLEENPNTYRYVDGIKPAVYEANKRATESLYYLFLEPEIAIQKCVWNPNRLTSGWVASGGAAGLCRVEFVGVGEDWLNLSELDNTADR
ncbi:hypothetical protein BC943DRAFT_355036 [Umbelopsis sp. AD052]|nr:hypothetical protein BC943DRAFT_355036 [Umbelopsis sp. AD052]